MDKKQLAEGCGVFVNGQWQVKNLKFLTEFMNQTGLTTGDIAKGVGLLRNSVTRWFMVDDTTLSRIRAYQYRSIHLRNSVLSVGVVAGCQPEGGSCNDEI